MPSLQASIKLMCSKPPWATGLPPKRKSEPRFKKLDVPLSGKAVLKCKLQYTDPEMPSNGYLAFGQLPTRHSW